MLIKLEWLGWENYDNILSRFHPIPERYGQTDRQIYQSRASVCWCAIKTCVSFWGNRFVDLKNLFAFHLYIKFERVLNLRIFMINSNLDASCTQTRKVWELFEYGRLKMCQKLSSNSLFFYSSQQHNYYSVIMLCGSLSRELCPSVRPFRYWMKTA